MDGTCDKLGSFKKNGQENREMTFKVYERYNGKRGDWRL